MSLRIMIANEIKSIYDFHEYAISKEKIIELTDLFLEVMPEFTEYHIKDFIKRIRKGEYGILYKMPTSIMVMLQQYKKEYGKPKFVQ